MRTHLVSLVVSSLILVGVSSAPCLAQDRTPQSIIDRALKAGAEPGAVRLIQPVTRTIVRTIGQPGFVEAYERTALFPKMPAYIKKWRADIGDKVKKGEVLAELYHPELLEEWETKKALVKVAEKNVELARGVVKVAEADIKPAEAKIAEANAIKEKFAGDVERWDTYVKRVKKEVDQGVTDPVVRIEGQQMLRSSQASLDEAKARIIRAEAELLFKRAVKLKDDIAVAVAEANLRVAQSESMRLRAMVDYLVILAPYDGVVSNRNVNTGDFVVPPSGDSKRPEPIYVIDRTDIVRVFIDISEEDANYVAKGTKASVLIRGFRDQQIPCTVTRTSWALNAKSRTLRAEVDLPNIYSKILPGMYAYARVLIQRPNVLALPLGAVFSAGDKIFCWTYENGKAKKTQIQTRVDDGEWVEVTNRLAIVKGEQTWVEIDGSEKVILAGDPYLLTDGQAVKVADAETKVLTPRPFKGMLFKTEFTVPGGEKMKVSGMVVDPTLFRFEMDGSKSGPWELIGGGDTFWLKKVDNFKEYSVAEDKGTFDGLSALAYSLSLPYRLPDLNKTDYKLKFAGEQVANGFETVVLRASHELYPEALLYFDKASGHLVKSKFKLAAADKLFGKGKAKNLEVFYENYKNFDGVRQFTRLKLRTDVTIECDLRDLRFPTGVAAGSFRKPY